MYNNSRQKVGSSKTANTICIFLSIFALATLILGLWTKNPYWLIAGIVPSAIYEAIRTEGYYTKIASGAIAILVIVEIFAIMGFIKINLATMLGTSEAFLGGYFIPLGEITLLFPLIAVILSIILLRRTYGPYTKWLSILLIACSVALLYVVNKDMLLMLLQGDVGGYGYGYY